MSFGVYFHIPYCVQRCPYCDFATYEQSKIGPISDYVNCLHQEIQQRHKLFNQYPKIETIFFGGGTPSLLDPNHILTLLEALAKCGFEIVENVEVTIEINPGTLSPNSLDNFQAAGVNRFSVGAQTFNKDHLNRLGRIHTVNDTLDTLRLLKAKGVNYSFDLMHTLPYQSMDELDHDLSLITKYMPNHVSLYTLTVDERNPLRKGQPSDQVSANMFWRIRDELNKNGYSHYEVSNFAQPGFESKHNNLYWTDQSYWGIGLGAHSYHRHLAKHGVRFWNPRSMPDYESLIAQDIKVKTFDDFKESNVSREELSEEEWLTDYLHTQLRLLHGLADNALQCGLSAQAQQAVYSQFERLKNKGYLFSTSNNDQKFWKLTDQGLIFSNQVNLELTFLKGQFNPSTH